MNELVSRQDVIKAIRKSTEKYNYFMGMENYTDEDAIEAVMSVPTIISVFKKDVDKCLGINCPMQVGSVPLDCNNKNCPWRTEYNTNVYYIITDLEDNLPFTWEKLKQMEGKPIWVEYNLHLNNKEYQNKSRTWDIIDHFGTCMDNVVMFTEKGFIFGKENQGIQWQAYKKERE